MQRSDFATKAHDHSDDNYLHWLYDIHVRTLSKLATPYARIL